MFAPLSNKSLQIVTVPDEAAKYKGVFPVYK
jgi:hypothetical protein